MKKMIILTLLLLAIVSGQVFAANKTVSINFIQNDGNQGFTGGQFIGPYVVDSSNWNNTINRLTGDLATGTMEDLTSSTGDATGINVSWASSGVDWVGSAADDDHKITVGYLDDGAGVSITLTNIPYASYKIVGLFASDVATSMANYSVNGVWVLGGDATTVADAYKTIDVSKTATGEFWTQVEPGVAAGNYWVADATGATCTITADRNGGSRASLAGLIIITDEVVLPLQRSISVNYVSGQFPGYASSDEVSHSSNAFAGYISDPCEGNGYLSIQQTPTATWNEGDAVSTANLPIKAKDELGNSSSAILLNSNHFSWSPRHLRNISTFFDGTDLASSATDWEFENAVNNLRFTQGFIGIGNTYATRNPLTAINKIPYSDYTVVTYMHPNVNTPQEIQIEDQGFYYLAQKGEFFQEILKDPNGPNNGWVVATDTEGPVATKIANLAIFRGLSAPNMEVLFRTPNNSGISAFQIISNISADDVVIQTAPGNIDKNFGDLPVSPLTTILSWDAPFNGADSYIVNLGVYDTADPMITDPNFAISVVDSANTTGSFTPVLEYGKTYIWRVDTVRGGETFSGDYFYFDTQGDPILQVQPRSVSVELGSNTFFDVTALVTDTYTWFSSEDAAIDTPEDDVELQSSPDAQFNIVGVQETDAKYYYVVLTSTIPASAVITSNVASLEIGKLELYMPFDGDPCDLSGNEFNGDYANKIDDPSNPGQLIPTAPLTYSTGYDGIGQAASFTRGEGGQIIVLGSDDYFNFYPKGFTVRLWVKPASYEGLNGYMSFISKNSSGWRLYDEAFYGSQGYWASMNTVGAGTSYGRLDDGDWHMIACTYDGATQEMKVYQEGVLQNTVIGSLITPVSYPITIGSHDKTGTGGWGYSGLIDEVEILSYAVSEADMLNDYAASLGGICLDEDNKSDLNDDCQVNMGDLVLVAENWLESEPLNPDLITPAELTTSVVSWQFDETSGMVATDSSGNGNDGTLGTGFTTGQWAIGAGRTGVIGDNALYMDGSADMSVIANVADADNFANGTANIFKGTASWTINLWVKFAVPTGMVNIGGFGDCAFNDGSGDSDRYFAAFGDYNGYEFETGEDGFWPGMNLADGDWKMLTITFDGTTNSGAAYLNGAQVGNTKTIALVDTDENAFKVNAFGAIIWEDGQGIRSWLNGFVDDFTVWDVAFTPEKIAEMYPTCLEINSNDLNGDCIVNLKDFVIVASDWLECGLVPSSLCD